MGEGVERLRCSSLLIRCVHIAFLPAAGLNHYVFDNKRYGNMRQLVY